MSKLVLICALISTASSSTLDPQTSSNESVTPTEHNSQLLSIPANLDNQLLSRHRRFLLPASTGWRANIYLLAYIPLQNFGGSGMYLALPLAYNANTGVVTGRTFDEGEYQRNKLITLVENLLFKFVGVNGHMCMLRTMCEVAQVPEHTDGFVGDLFNVFLAPSHIMETLSDIENANEYVRAQRDGRIYDNCSAYHNGCPYSFFELVERASAYSNGTMLPSLDPKQYLDYHDLEADTSFQQDYSGFSDSIMYNNPADLQQRRPGFEKFREQAAMFNK